MSKLYLPALRGKIGDWAYYSCLMTFEELANHVNIADVIHKSECLSQYIQRQLKGDRAEEIANYIIQNNSRFFSSIVVAVYGGSPEWYQLDHLRNVINGDDLIKENISDNAIASIGFLCLSGEENLFALDGQHRLIGIKNSLKNKKSLNDEEIPVIFVAHKKDEAGMIRTRRLFIDLNKTAKPVKKDEIIALDEADVMAIVTRWLIEDNSNFSQNRILISHATSMPPANLTHWTNINNLYDVLVEIFSNIKPSEEKERISKKELIAKLTANRLPDEQLKKYKKYAEHFFSLLAKNFKEISEYFESKNPEIIVAKYRSNGGSVLFRPVGLLVFTKLIAEYIKKYKCSLENAFKIISKLDTNITHSPYNLTIWNNSEKRLVLKRKTLLTDILKYQLDLINDRKIYDIKKRLADAHEKDIKDIKLPEKLV